MKKSGFIVFLALSIGGATMSVRANTETSVTNALELQKRIHELEQKLQRATASMKSVRYGLNWVDCPEAFDAVCENKIPVLTEVAEKAIVQNDGKPTHILIEGDNYHALQCLNFTHRGRIDVIYIDPPYNTGSDGFTYKDKRFLEQYPNGEKIDKNHPLRHSAWLSFMEKRLKSSKTLLRDDGVVFISIDDNEMANLKLLCDKVFLEKNFIADMIWKSKSGGANDTRIAVDTEHILVYARCADKVKIGLDDEATVTTSYNREDEFGRYALDRLDKQSLGYEESLDFPITGPDGKVYRVIHRDPNHKVARWRWGKSTVEARYDELVFENGFVYTKNYESDASVPRNLLVEERFGRTRSGKTELFAIIGANKFPNPKPSKLISYLVGLFDRKNCIVLDYFAGSGTTLHAVLAQNEKDGGARQCILCTNNEGNICDDVTYPRASNVLNGYVSKGKVTVELLREKLTITKLKKAQELLAEVKSVRDRNASKYESIKAEVKEGCLLVTGEQNINARIEGLGGSLKYYRAAFVGKHGCAGALDEDRSELAEKAGCLLALAEDTLLAESVAKKNAKYWQHYSDGAHRHTLIYYSDDLAGFEALSKKADALRAADKAARLAVYVFTIGSVDAFENEFDDMKQITIKPIPEPILEIYKTINEG